MACINYDLLVDSECFGLLCEVVRATKGSYLVDLAGCHMFVSKIKSYMYKYKPFAL